MPWLYVRASSLQEFVYLMKKDIVYCYIGGMMTMVTPDDKTRAIQRAVDGGVEPEAKEIIREIYLALQEKGYDPVRQIAHYLLTGEPAYITAHRNARALVRKLERDEVLEELVRNYLKSL